MRFETRENLKQPLGLLHGGIYSAVAETVASVATVYAVWEDGFIGSGLSNSASFLRPVTDGAVDVTARLRHHDDREWLWGHDFRDEQGRLCALVDVTIAVRPVALPDAVTVPAAGAVELDGARLEVLDLPGPEELSPLVLLLAMLPGAR